MIKNITYAIITFNKLNYLKTVVNEIVRSIDEDEEIIIIDGGSTDGTVDYMDGLKRQGLINYYVSEKDKGESHACNKALLLANGKLIKLLTDDDAYYYPAIKACKEYMLSHDEIDVMAGNTASMDMSNKQSLFWDEVFYLDFLNWKEGNIKRFFFNGTCLMLRKSSLPLIGLVDTNILLADMEYTLRMTGVVNLAWCKSIISVRILNQHSNNRVFKQRSEEESKRLCSYYNYKYPWERKDEEQKKKTIYKKARSFAAKIIKLLRKSEKKNPAIIESFSSFEEAHNYCQKWMTNHEFNKEIKFLIKE